ncbi:MAG: GAF domain-containing protein [candidate division Zixibacteria bacterium]|nr:GAF domain-containing protein [candidate division Zixibacteria bacterium]
MSTDGISWVALLGVAAIVLIATWFARHRGWWGPRRSSLSAQTADLWVRVAREVAAAPTLDQMLMGVGAALRTALGARAAHVFKISRARGRAIRVGAATDPTNTRPTIYDHDRLSALAAETATTMDLASFPGADSLMDAIIGLPLGTENGVTAAILVEQPEVYHTDPAVSTHLRAVAALVGRAIQDWALAARGLTVATLRDNLSRHLPDLLSAGRMEHGLPIIAQTLRNVVDGDYLYLAWWNHSRTHEDRAGLLTSDGRMVEARRGWPIGEGTSRRIMALRRPFITPDLRPGGLDSESDPDAWEQRLGMRSRLVVPVMVGRRPVGSLTVASRRIAAYGESDAQLLAVLAQILSCWLEKLEASRRSDRAAAVQTYVSSLLWHRAVWPGESVLLREALAHLNVSGLRLYRVDDDTMMLNEVGACGRATRGGSPRRIPVNRLPWHRWALDSGRILRLDQSDPEALVGDAEVALALDLSIKTGCLVPIASGTRRLGVLDVIEHRDPGRSGLDMADQLLLTVLAELIAEHWGATDPAMSGGRGQNGHEDREVLLKNFSREIVNPLTSIIGSVELIRHKQPGLGADAMRYLAIIERSASRIHGSSTQFLDTIASTTGNGADPRLTDVVPVGRRENRIGPGHLAGFARPASVRDLPLASPGTELVVTGTTRA